MKGLFIKDCYLNFSNRRSLVLFLFMSVFMAFAMDGTFIIGYTGMLLGILAIGTISYDSNDNGMSFLMCLPVSRKDYVKEKFLYSFAMEVIGFLLGSIIFFLACAVKGVPVDLISELSFGAGFALTMSLTLFLMTYIELKYGVEKSRTAMFVMYGIAFILAFAVKQIQGLQNGLIAFAGILLRMPVIALVTAVLILYLLIVFVLYRLSLRAMEKKEF